jgi:demethylmenaquinone methyltransferase/2-methoxy-6-polyprenyl-1,4-benzoquinol methylase
MSEAFPAGGDAVAEGAPSQAKGNRGVTEGSGGDASDKGERVREIFQKIARKYELFNALSSLGIYRSWLSRLARTAACSPDARVIDVAGGTGDVSFELCRICPPASIELTDFTPEMLAIADEHIGQGKSCGVPVHTRVADAMDLPYEDASFDVYTVAYGLRNFADRERSMREARRVLCEGGTYVALEFSTPANPVWHGIYNLYLGHVIPFVGGHLTHDRAGFDYLVSSIREFPPQAQIVEELCRSGFSSVEYYLCTGGIATIYRAVAR